MDSGAVSVSTLDHCVAREGGGGDVDLLGGALACLHDLCGLCLLFRGL